MVEVRSAEVIETSVHIGKLNLPLPNDHSWVPLPVDCWIGTCDAYSDLYTAFDTNLIEVRIIGQSEYPQWYLDVLSPNFESVERLLHDSEDLVVSKIENIMTTAHPAIWLIIRRNLYQNELLGEGRPAVTHLLQPNMHALEVEND